MKRRSFLQNVAVASAAINWPSRKSESVLATTIESPPTPTPDIAGQRRRGKGDQSATQDHRKQHCGHGFPSGDFMGF